MAGENRFSKYNAQPEQRGIVIADPYREAEEERKRAEEARRQQDQAFEAQRLEIARQNAAVTAANANKPPAGYQFGPGGALQFIPGGPADPAVVAQQATAGKVAKPPAVNPDRLPQIESMLENIRRVREMADETLAVGKLSGRVGEWPVVGSFLGQNRANVEGALQMIQGDLIQQQIALLSQVNGGNGVASIANSETEAARMAASIANLDPNQSYEEFLQGLERAEQYYLRQLDRQQADVGSAPVALSAAGMGATEQGVPLPPEMQAENEAWLAQNLGSATPAEYAAFRQSLDRKYNFAPASEAGLTSWFEAAQRNAAAGGKTQTAIPPATEELSGFEQGWNNVVSHPAGTFVANMANAGSFGLPSLLAGEQYDAIREENPWSAGLGEVAGGITGTLTGGAGLGMLAGQVANPKIASLLASPLTADIAYGGAYGATQADDPLYGAFLGAGASGAGSVLGSQVAKRAPGMVGLGRPADTLGAGERRILDAAKRTGIDPVAEALSQATELGVPATLADVSPDVNSLTGAALRRSPNAAGQARDILGQRSRGQYDRFLGAVERDLGPIENIPQRSEDLIGQARAAAAPLYESAYAAPGASAVDLSDLAGRPSFTKALGNARRIALEEGRDPTTLGFDLDGAGEVILTRVPSFQTLDYVKRGLDDVVEGYRDPTSGRLVLDTEGKAVNDTLRDFISRVDAVNPDYAAARAAYAGPAAEREALRRGQEALRMSPNQLGVNVANSSPAQADQMRLGFQSALGEQAGNYRMSTNPFESTLGTPGMEQRLASLYPEAGDSIARLLAQRDLERQLAGSTNRLVGNSMTAERAVADQAFDQSSLMGNVAQGVAETAVTGAPVVTALRSGMGRGLGGAVRDWRTLGLGKQATAIADEIAPIALNTDPAAAKAALDELVQRDLAQEEIIKELLKSAAVRGGHLGAGVASSLMN